MTVPDPRYKDIALAAGALGFCFGAAVMIILYSLAWLP